MKEMDECNRAFYSVSGVAARFWRTLWQRRKPLINLIANLSTMRNSRAESLSYPTFEQHLATLVTPLPIDLAGVITADSDNRPCAD
jgi:transposase